MLNHMYLIPHWTASSRSAISVHVLRYFKKIVLSAYDEIEKPKVDHNRQINIRNYLSVS